MYVVQSMTTHKPLKEVVIIRKHVCASLYFNNYKNKGVGLLWQNYSQKECLADDLEP